MATSSENEKSKEMPNGDSRVSHPLSRNPSAAAVERSPLRPRASSDISDDKTVKSQDSGSVTVVLSARDLALVSRLDSDYERALESVHVGYAARYQSVRQSALCSIMFMTVLLVLGTIFFIKQAPGWTPQEAVLFSLYTVTTVGYGHLAHPETPAFQLYVVGYILVGIATLTIMVAQIYQCIALEASRAHVAADGRWRRGGKKRGLSTDGVFVDASLEGSERGSRSSSDCISQLLDRLLVCVQKLYRYFRDDELGRGISVIFPLSFLVAVGAIVIGVIEQWTVTESLYFSICSLTTVGFGDYYPTRTASIIFCILWLPFSVGFMSMYLAQVAAFYIRLSDRNVDRIERGLRLSLQREKEKVDQERQEALDRAMRGQQLRDMLGEEDHDLSLNDESPRDTATTIRKSLSSSMSKSSDEENNLAGADPSREGFYRQRLVGMEFTTAQSRRERIWRNSQGHNSGDLMGQGSVGDEGVLRPEESSLTTMKDVLAAIHSNSTSDGAATVRSGPDSEYLSVSSKQPMLPHHTPRRRGTLIKPSFALRALVQERFAEIIAYDIAGYQSSITIQDFSLTVTIARLKVTADKWMIPRRARKAFRAVAFEAVWFMGERDLICHGAEAMFRMKPVEFHHLFAPLVAALGDAATMEDWMESTEVLADIELKGPRDEEHFVEQPLVSSGIGVEFVTSKSGFAA